MLREQMISLLQTSVVFLVLTNAASLAAAVYAVRANRSASRSQPPSVIERNAQAIMRRAMGH